MADTHTHSNVVLNYISPAKVINYISPAKVKAEYTPGAIGIGMRDLMIESKQQPMDTIRIGMQDLMGESHQAEPTDIDIHNEIIDPE